MIIPSYYPHLIIILLSGIKSKSDINQNICWSQKPIFYLESCSFHLGDDVLLWLVLNQDLAKAFVQIRIEGLIDGVEFFNVIFFKEDK